jgi:hypothetical protein
MAEKSPVSTSEGPKSKLRTIMEAASALTALGDEEEKGNSCEKNQAEANDAKEARQRYIPEHKKPDAALTFPEKVRTQKYAMLYLVLRRSQRRSIFLFR